MFQIIVCVGNGMSQITVCVGNGMSQIIVCVGYGMSQIIVCGGNGLSHIIVNQTLNVTDNTVHCFHCYTVNTGLNLYSSLYIEEIFNF